MFSSKTLGVVVLIVIVLAVLFVDFCTGRGVSGFLAGQDATDGAGDIIQEITLERGVTGSPGGKDEGNLGEAQQNAQTYPGDGTGTNDTGEVTGGFHGGGTASGGRPPKPPKEPKPPKKAHFSLDENPTNRWMDIYGNLTIGGEPARVGDEVAAFDPDGVLCGVFSVRAEGIYGFLHVYGDDYLSPEDEGARTGDTITFKVYDWSENEEFDAVSISISWSGNKERINVYLVA